MDPDPHPDPHQCEKPEGPDPHQSEKPDSDPHQRGSGTLPRRLTLEPWRPLQYSMPDPGPHQNKKLDPDLDPHRS